MSKRDGFSGLHPALRKEAQGDLENILYKADGTKYDLKADPDDVTGLMEADPELRKQMLAQGLVAHWAIDGRYRLTAQGKKIRDMRMEAMREAREQNLIQPFDNPELDRKAQAAQEHDNEH